MPGCSGTPRSPLASDQQSQRIAVLESVMDKMLQSTNCRSRDLPAVPGLTQDQQPVPAVLSDPRMGNSCTPSVQRKLDFKE